MTIEPEIGGDPCFAGSGVRREIVVDNLAGGHSVQEILENYPSLRLEQIEAVLRWERDLARQADNLALDRPARLPGLQRYCRLPEWFCQ